MFACAFPLLPPSAGARRAARACSWTLERATRARTTWTSHAAFSVHAVLAHCSLRVQVPAVIHRVCVGTCCPMGCAVARAHKHARARSFLHRPSGSLSGPPRPSWPVLCPSSPARSRAGWRLLVFFTPSAGPRSRGPLLGCISIALEGTPTQVRGDRVHVVVLCVSTNHLLTCLPAPRPTSARRPTTHPTMCSTFTLCARRLLLSTWQVRFRAPN